jgi:hypothetical protein
MLARRTAHSRLPIRYPSSSPSTTCNFILQLTFCSNASPPVTSFERKKKKEEKLASKLYSVTSASLGFRLFIRQERISLHVCSNETMPKSVRTKKISLTKVDSARMQLAL